MAYVDFIMKLHKSSKRDYVERVVSYDKAECAEVAIQYGKDYWPDSSPPPFAGRDHARARLQLADANRWHDDWFCHFRP